MSDKGWYGTSNVAEALRRIGNDFEEHHEERRWLHEIADEIERLLADVQELEIALSKANESSLIKDEETQRLRERIEELEFLQSEMLKVADRNGWKVTDNHHIITSNQIRRVWGILSGWNEDYADRVIAAAVRSTLEAAFKELGIVRCGGVGRNGWRCIGEKCPACHGKGWIIASDAICSKRSTNND